MRARWLRFDLCVVAAVGVLTALGNACDLNPQPLPPDRNFSSGGFGGDDGGGGGSSGASGGSSGGGLSLLSDASPTVSSDAGGRDATAGATSDGAADGELPGPEGGANDAFAPADAPADGPEDSASEGADCYQESGE